MPEVAAYIHDGLAFKVQDPITIAEPVVRVGDTVRQQFVTINNHRLPDILRPDGFKYFFKFLYFIHSFDALSIGIFIPKRYVSKKRWDFWKGTIRILSFNAGYR